MSEAVPATSTATATDDAAGDCPDCAGHTRTEGNEVVCQACGLVVDADHLDRGPDWCTLDDDGSSNRGGAPMTERLHDKGLATTIGQQPQDRSVAPAKRRRLERMRTWHRRSKFEGRTDRNCAHGLSEIRRMAVALGQPEAHQEQACRLFKSAQDQDLLRGRTIEGIAAAACYAVGRINQTAVTLADIAGVARVGRDHIDYCYRLVNRRLGVPAPPPAPQQYVGSLVDDCGLDVDVRRRATQLLDRAGDAGLGTGCHPVGVAAGAVYVAAGGTDGDLTQVTVADSADIAPATLRKHYKAIVEVADDGE